MTHLAGFKTSTDAQIAAISCPFGSLRGGKHIVTVKSLVPATAAAAATGPMESDSNGINPLSYNNIFSVNLPSTSRY